MTFSFTDWRCGIDSVLWETAPDTERRVAYRLKAMPGDKPPGSGPMWPPIGPDLNTPMFTGSALSAAPLGPRIAARR